MAQAFDAGRLELRGQAFVVEGGIGRSSTGAGSYSVSGTGTLAYAGTLSTPGRLTWFDRGGNPSDSAGSLGDYTDFRLSPDQTRLAASVADPKTGFPDIWITDLTRRSSAPFTFGPAVNASAVWAPDGARIIFRTSRNGGISEFYSKSAGGGGTEEPVLPADDGARLGCSVRQHDAVGLVSRTDGICSSRRPRLQITICGCYRSRGTRSRCVFCLRRAISGTAIFRRTASWWHTPRVSPAALKSTSRPFPSQTDSGPSPRPAGTSRAGGLMAASCIYLSTDQKVMAVAIGPGPSFGAPMELFPVRVAGRRELAAHALRPQPRRAAISHQHANR